MFRLVFSPSWVLIIAALLTVQGCQTLQSNDGLLEQESSNAKVSSRQLRIVLDDLVLQFSSQVELAADQIIAENDDPQICKNALLWKMNGISSCFQAASRRDPLGSYFDIWILNKQTLALFEQPNNTPLFGESQDIAIAATKQIETSMADVLDLIGDDLPINENFATAFATDHPINDLYFKRASITANYTKYIDSINLKGPELLGIASDIDEQLDQLQRVSSMYAEFIPKQARWNGELMILETLQSNAITSSLQNMSLAASGVAAIADTTQAIPELVERERNLLQDAITGERIATMQVIDQMRSETLNRFREERIAVMGKVESERTIVLKAIDDQRIAATRDLTHLSEQSLEKIDQVVDTKIADVAVHSSDLIDHGFRRLAQLIGAIAVLALLGFAGHLLIRKQRQIKAESKPTTDAPIRIHPAGTERPATALKTTTQADNPAHQKQPANHLRYRVRRSA